MKKSFLYFVIIFLLISFLHAGEGIELNNINATWTRVLPGKLICEPQTTSQGFAVITDAHSLISFTSQGRIVYEKLLVRANGAIFGVLQNDFIAVITGSSKRITLLNPDGRELWTTTTDFKINQSPYSGRDGRFFVRSEETIACYSLNGIQKWKLTTPAQAKMSLNELPNGSLILMLKELDSGKTKALRISPFGEIEEEITFAGEVTRALTTPQGILLVFTDGTSGLFDLDTEQNKSTHRWLFKKDAVQKTNKDFFILSQDESQVVYVNIKASNVEIDYINLTDGSIKDSFIIEEQITPEYGWYNNSGIFIADSKNAFFYNNAGRYLWSGTLPALNSKQTPTHTSFTVDNCFLLFGKDWSIHAFRTAHAPETNSKQTEQKKDYSYFYNIDTALMELPLPIPIDKNLLAENRTELLLKGNYGSTEKEYASQLLSICTVYKNLMTTTNFGTRLEKSVFETDTAGMENILSQLNLFGTDTLCDYTAFFLRKETNKTLIHTLLRGIVQNSYDPQGKILESLEYLVHNTSEKDETLLKDICDAVYSICITNGVTAIEPRGKDTLTTMLYPNYTSVTRDYARNTLKKLVGK